MAASGHLDTFARDNLPPRDQLPAFLDSPDTRYPARMNAAVELLDARVDDLDGRRHIRAGGQHLLERHIRTLQGVAQHKGQLHLHTRHDEAAGRNLAAVSKEHVVEQRTVVGLVNLRGLLHRARRQADLVPDHAAALRGTLAPEIEEFDPRVPLRDAMKSAAGLPDGVSLIAEEPVRADEQRTIEHQLHQVMGGLDEWLSLSATILAGAVGNAAVVTRPRAASSRLRHAQLVELNHDTALLVAVIGVLIARRG